MGHDFNITKEDLERIDKKKSLLRVPISYMASEDMEFPDTENSFTPKEVKLNKKTVTEIVDIKKNKKNKSNKLL